MKYAFGMESGATIYILSLIETGSGSQNFVGQNSQTACNPISLFSCFQNKERRLIMQLILLMVVKLKKVLCLLN
jgi:hypothetical protein